MQMTIIRHKLSVRSLITFAVAIATFCLQQRFADAQVSIFVKAQPSQYVQVNMSAAFTHTFISSDGTPGSAISDDFEVNFFSSTHLTSPTITLSGITYNIGAPNVKNCVYSVVGSTISVTSGQYSELHIIGSTSDGNSNIYVDANYSDASTTRLDQTASDWYSPQSYPGESIALAAPYRNVGSDGSADNRTFNVYKYYLALNSAKTVSSITIQDYGGGGNTCIFAMTLKK
jgi:hypothetical protein